MNGFDTFLLAVLAVFIAIGAWRGFVRELVSLLTWVVACVAAWSFAPALGPLFDGITADESLQQMLAFIVVVVTIFIAGFVLGYFLHRLVKLSNGARWANRIAGVGVGAARGVAILVVVFLLAGLTPLPQRGWWREARLAPLLESVALYAARYLPADIARHVRYG